MYSKYLFLLMIIFSTILSGCHKDEPIATEDLLSQHISGTHFEYYFSETDADIIDTTWQEEYFLWFMEELDLDPNLKLEYRKYRDRAHLEKVTGKETNGFAEVGTNKFHTIWKIDSHESVHSIVTMLMGHPPPLFNEGIAVAYQADYFQPGFIPGWNGQDFHVLSKSFLDNGSIPSLDNLLSANTFFDISADVTYPVAGSFVRYLIDTYGIYEMKDFINLSDFEDSKSQIRIDFQNAYGFSIDDAWNEWILFIQ